MQPHQKKEIMDLTVSVLVIAFIFSIVVGLSLFPIFIAIVIFSFVFHELAHRFVAKKFGYVAFYKMWPFGLMASLLLVAGMKIIGVPLIVIAPGAVIIMPYTFGRWKFDAKTVSRDMGLIAVAGPCVNLFFAVLFGLFPGWIFGFMSWINALLAFFNLLPVPPLDGSKVFKWKSWFWLVLFVISIVLVWFR